jgi:hypothetical protein
MGIDDDGLASIDASEDVILVHDRLHPPDWDSSWLPLQSICPQAQFCSRWCSSKKRGVRGMQPTFMLVLTLGRTT